MRIISIFDDTRIRISEDHQDYKRTVYVLDHDVTAAAVVSTSTTLLQIQGLRMSAGIRRRPCFG